MQDLNQFYKGKVSRNELFIIFVGICFTITVVKCLV